jgi:hypothetical protein
MYIKPATITRVICFALGIFISSGLVYLVGLESTVLIACGVLWASFVRGEGKV